MRDKRDKNKNKINQSLRSFIAGGVIALVNLVLPKKVFSAIPKIIFENNRDQTVETAKPELKFIKHPNKINVEASEKLAAKFIDEVLEYDISFMWIKKAAEGKVSFKRSPDRPNCFIATVEAKTTGLIGVFTSHREEYFTTELEVMEVQGNYRFVPLSFDHVTHKTSSHYRAMYTFDYAKRIYNIKVLRNGRLRSVQNRKIREDVYFDDFLSTFYNFRAQCYGQVSKDWSFKVRTIPIKGVENFEVKVANDSEMQEESNWISQYPNAKWMVILTINQKIFGIKAGTAKLLGTEDLIPIAGYVKEVITFGDVEATLVKPFVAKCKS